MKKLTFFAFISLALVTAACSGADDDDPKVDAGPQNDAALDGDENGDSDAQAEIIAPSCESSSCYEVSIRSSLSCETFGNGDNDYTFESKLAIEGKTEKGGCTVYSDSEGERVDLHCQVLPPEGAETPDYSEVYFRLKDYKGPGTYELIDEDDLGGAGRGLTLRGNVDSSEHPDKFGTAFTTPCGQGCVAKVSDRSEPAGAPGELFRFEVDITCPNGPLVDAIPTSCSRGTRCTPSEDTVLHIEAVAKR